MESTSSGLVFFFFFSSIVYSLLQHGNSWNSLTYISCVWLRFQSVCVTHVSLTQSRNGGFRQLMVNIVCIINPVCVCNIFRCFSETSHFILLSRSTHFKYLMQTKRNASKSDGSVVERDKYRLLLLFLVDSNGFVFVQLLMLLISSGDTRSFVFFVCVAIYFQHGDMVLTQVFGIFNCSKGLTEPTA